MNNSITLTIDSQSVTVPAGSTVLDAARQLGLNIPTLCHLAGVKENRPSCMACVVRIGNDPRLSPSCSTKVAAGMVVASETHEVKSARKAAMELLFSDHLGDCVSVCQRVCPARLQIPATIRLVAGGRMREAIALVKQNVVFPGVMGRICRAPCQAGCRRGKYDGAVAIQLIEREISNQDLAAAEPFTPACAAPTGKRIAIVGAGATGLSAAFFLMQSGHSCTVLDDHDKPGGHMRYGVPDTELPRAVLDGEIEVIKRLGLQLRLNMRLGRDIRLEELRQQFDSVIISVGNMQKTNPAGLGVEATARTIRIDSSTYQTSVPGVFAAGSAIRSGYDPARSVGDGRILAECVDSFLNGREHHVGQKDFTSTIPKLPTEEYQELAKGAVGVLSVRELITEAEIAAGRCCHCDCRSAGNCRLRIFAEAYQVDPKAYQGEHRRRFEFIRQPAGVIFEPGKCISCGICIELASQARVPLGMTYIGRGFDLKIGVPLNGPLADGLQQVAEDCVKHCPTGALAFEDESKNAIKNSRRP
ncbi:MAG: 2Fe-2S iron-sulfur cluster-binding protein [Methylacidiphilales bacterium]|nr:2Fe-2S iron-sulfur cluster-binding protein [Candidatus Methylacidiphilales bacterium]